MVVRLIIICYGVDRGTEESPEWTVVLRKYPRVASRDSLSVLQRGFVERCEGGN